MKKADRERIRAEAAKLAEVKKAAPAAAVPAVSSPTELPPQKPIGKGKPYGNKKPNGQGAVIRFACGHSGNAPLCISCRKKKNAARAAKYQNTRNDRRNSASLRLPDGADYHTVYSAVETMWSGTLVVNIGGKEETLVAKHSALFKLLETLDRMYREKSGVPWPEAKA